MDWENLALRVPSRKTRRYQEERPTPITPELQPLLQAAWDIAPEGGDTVITLGRHSLHRRFKAILKEAGIPMWDDFWQTLRRSCETHLVALGHPEHNVSFWLGHSPRVSKDHYLMVTSEAFKKATEPNVGSFLAGPKTGPAQSTQWLAKSSKEGCEECEDREENQPNCGECKDLRDSAGGSGVARAGIEPAAHGFSIRCSTN